MKTKTNKTKKRISTILAILMILALLLTGTYAWVDYSQHRTNEFDNTNSKTYDIYLVEDFEPVHNWTTSDAPKLKNISVMNKGEAPEFGAGYVRLSLKEYFEFSDKTYTYSTNWYALDNSGDYISFDYPDDAAGEADAIADAEARGYFNGVGYETDYTSGVEGWFAIAGADHINGQYGKHMITGIENSTPDSLAPGVERAEYEETENHKLSPTGECAYTPHDWTGVDQFGFRDYVKWNLGENVISLTEWATKSETEKDDFKGWIYDNRTTSGYVYWSQPLDPEEKTTNLLETVELINQPTGDFYYALHVDMETLSLDELAKEFYEWQDAPEKVIEYWLRRPRPSVPETPETPETQEGFRFEINTDLYGQLSIYNDFIEETNNNCDSNQTEFGINPLNIILNINSSAKLGMGEVLPYDIIVDWGDGTISESNVIEHTYSEPGIYIITIYGELPGGIGFCTVNDTGAFTSEQRLTRVLDPLPNQVSTNMYGTFAFCSNLTYIPEALFENNAHVTSFYATFATCYSLENIPENLFANNVDATDFTSAFTGSGITAIPENLFANNILAETFFDTFECCMDLKVVPKNLFKNNHAIKSFYHTFYRCNSISGLLPELWVDTDTKFPMLTNHFNTFGYCTGALNHGDAIEEGWA